MGSESPVYKLLAGVVEGQGLCWLLGIVQLFSTLSTVVRQALLSMEFSRQEYWSGWVVHSFSRGFFRSRDQTQISCIAGRFFTI